MELQLQHLSKCYGAKQAVNDVSTVLTPGVYGLLGANGAGKTTLMRMICGVLKPTSGSICLNGKSIDELGEDYYAHLGYMPQDFGFYPDFTAREFMLYMAAVKGLDRKEATTRTGELLKLVNLHHENGNVRLRMIHDTSPAADAITVPPSLEDLFLYHFGEERGE